MLRKVHFKTHRSAWAIVVGAITAISTLANAHSVFLGPENPGAERGWDRWYNGAKGSGVVSIDSTDPATGKNDFALGNITPGAENCADWRSESFALGAAADGKRPITFSFAYKFPGAVIGRENMSVYLRFFDATGTNFLKEKIIRVGSNTSDSNMARYKRLTVSNIHAPKRAQMADVRVTANHLSLHPAENWTSGTGRFDDFSVTASSPPIWAEIFGGIGIFAVLGALLVAQQRRKRQAAH